MKHNKQELDAIINDATSAIRDEQIDPSIIEKSATSVWALVRQQAADDNSSLGSINTMNTENTAEQIRGCADFQSLIPAYLDGKLSTARTLLLKDHSNECIPCRNELKAQKAYATTKSATYVAPHHTRGAARKSQNAPVNAVRKTNVARWGVAAALVVSLGLAGMFFIERLDLSGRTLAATVENATGAVYVVSDTESRQLA
nr:zf-HC2 domain-containing protein [Blastocatellia bacterium]